MLVLNTYDTEQLRTIFTTHSSQSNFVTTLNDYLDENDSAIAASWLLKYAFEQGVVISKGHQRGLIEHINKAHQWQTHLHLLQCLPYCNIDTTQTPQLVNCLRYFLTHNNKFIRAWSYNGLYLIAKQYPEYKSETNSLLQLALKDEAPSVKARIRNLLK